MAPELVYSEDKLSPTNVNSVIKMDLDEEIEFKLKQDLIQSIMTKSLQTTIGSPGAIHRGLGKLVRSARLVTCRSIFYFYVDSGTKWVMLGYGLSCSALAEMVGFNTTVNYRASILPMIQKATRFSWHSIAPNYSFCFTDGRYSFSISTNPSKTIKVKETYMPTKYLGRNFCCNSMGIDSIGVCPRDFRRDKTSPLVQALLRSMSEDRLMHSLSQLADMMATMEGYSRPSWEFLIGPPDSGKTFFLDMISAVAGSCMGRIPSNSIWSPINPEKVSHYGYYRGLRFPDTDIRKISIGAIKSYASNDIYINDMEAPSRNCPKIIGAVNEIYKPVTLEQSMKPQLMKRIVITRFKEIDRKDRKDLEFLKADKYYKDLISYAIYVGYIGGNTLSLDHMLDTLSMGDPKNIHPDLEIRIGEGSRECTEIMAINCNTDVKNFLSCVGQLNDKYIEVDNEGLEYLKDVWVPLITQNSARSNKMDYLSKFHNRLIIDYCPSYYSVSETLMTRVDKYRYYASMYTKIYEKTLDAVMKLMANCAMNPITAVALVYNCDLNTLLHLIDRLKVERCKREDAQEVYRVIRGKLLESKKIVDKPYYNERVFAALDKLVKNPEDFNVTLTPTAISVYKHMRDTKISISEDAMEGRLQNEVAKIKMDDILIQANKIKGWDTYSHRSIKKPRRKKGEWVVNGERYRSSLNKKKLRRSGKIEKRFQEGEVGFEINSSESEGMEIPEN